MEAAGDKPENFFPPKNDKKSYNPIYLELTLINTVKILPKIKYNDFER
jgi:hypothetical protein